MKKRIWKFLPALVLAIVIVLAAGMLNSDAWLHASSGGESSREDTAVAPSEDVQGSTATQSLDLTTVPTEETQPSEEPAEEPTEETAEPTEEPTGEEPAEEATEAPSGETAEPEEITEPEEPSGPEDTVEPTEEETQPTPGISVIPVGYSGVYDGKTHKASCTVSVTAGTTITYSVDGGATWSATAPSIKDAGEVSFLVKAENPDYETVTSSGTLQVTPATITITTTGARKTYDGKPLTSSGIKVTGLVNGEYLKCSATGYRTDVGQGKNVYFINWFDSTAKYKNYTIVNDYGILEVTPATLTVTTYSGSKTYDGNPLTAGGMVSGLIWGETATFTVTGSQTEVGSSENTYTLVFDGTAKAENYVIKETLGTLTVK